MDVGVVHFESEHGHAHLFARKGRFDGCGHPLGKERHGSKFLVGEVENIVDLMLGHTNVWP